jgi:hypothetical protein
MLGLLCVVVLRAGIRDGAVRCVSGSAVASLRLEWIAAERTFLLNRSPPG